MNDITLLHGDCLDIMRKMESNSVDSIITDPPCGTIGLACQNTNRKFIGIERDDKYFEIAKNRIENNKTLWD